MHPPTLVFTLLPRTFAIARLAPDAGVPDWVRGDFVSVTRTSQELSVVCEDGGAPPESERGWRCLRVEGAMPLDITGVAAAFTKVLADAGISVFVIATFDTDYLLIRDSYFERAVDAFTAAGFVVNGLVEGWDT